jgi:hypothetical protein
VKEAPGTQGEPMEQQPNESRGLVNILKIAFLTAVLAGAWFLLDWLINR